METRPANQTFRSGLLNVETVDIYSIDLYVEIVIYFCLQVAAKALETAVFGAYYNVIINLKDISDTSFRVAVSSFYKTLSYPIKSQK